MSWEGSKNYLDQLGIQRDLVVTNGFRYKMYAATDLTEPIAYANLWKPKESALALFERIRRKQIWPCWKVNYLSKRTQYPESAMGCHSTRPVRVQSTRPTIALAPTRRRFSSRALDSP